MRSPAAAITTKHVLFLYFLLTALIGRLCSANVIRPYDYENQERQNKVREVSGG